MTGEREARGRDHPAVTSCFTRMVQAPVTEMERLEEEQTGAGEWLEIREPCGKVYLRCKC